MPISYDIDVTKGQVSLVWVGQVPITDWAVLMDRIQADARFQREFVFLSDRRAVTTAPTVEEIQCSVEYFKANREGLGRSTWAILVAPSLVDFGMMRMGEALADDLIVMAYFKDMQQAEAWLKGIRSERLKSGAMGAH